MRAKVNFNDAQAALIIQYWGSTKAFRAEARQEARRYECSIEEASEMLYAEVYEQEQKYRTTCLHCGHSNRRCTCLEW